MKKVFLAIAILFSLGCSKSEDFECTQVIYKRKMGEKFKAVSTSSWIGADQYKNYDYSYRDENGDVWIIKTVVTCK